MTPKMRSTASSLLSSSGPPRRQKSNSQIFTTDSLKSIETGIENRHINLQVLNTNSVASTAASAASRSQQPNTYASCYQVRKMNFIVIVLKFN